MTMTPNDQLRLARAEAVANQQRSQMMDVLKRALEEAVKRGDKEGAAEIARMIRNKLLAACDAEVALDRLGLQVPTGSTFTAWLGFFKQLGEALVGEWPQYRQMLRDLTTQEGFPMNISWPTAPSGADGEPSPWDEVGTEGETGSDA